MVGSWEEPTWWQQRVEKGHACATGGVKETTGGGGDSRMRR